eukprot:3148862-Pleurochrysis_carterae.AAC.1
MLIQRRRLPCRLAWRRRTKTPIHGPPTHAHDISHANSLDIALADSHDISLADSYGIAHADSCRISLANTHNISHADS